MRPQVQLHPIVQKRSGVARAPTIDGKDLFALAPSGQTFDGTGHYKSMPRAVAPPRRAVIWLPGKISKIAERCIVFNAFDLASFFLSDLTGTLCKGINATFQ